MLILMHFNGYCFEIFISSKNAFSCLGWYTFYSGKSCFAPNAAKYWVKCANDVNACRQGFHVWWL